MCPCAPPSYLALDKHVEEVVSGLLWVAIHAQVAQVVVCDAEPWQVTDTDPLVVEAATLRAGDQVEQLLCLGGAHEGTGI